MAWSQPRKPTIWTAIDRDCENIFALFCPVAIDLRFLLAVLKINSNLERIGDHACDIAQITKSLANEPLLKPLVDIPLMAVKAREMLRESLDAFSHHDAAIAHAVPRKDDEVDRLYRKVFAELIQFMAKDPKAIGRASNLLPSSLQRRPTTCGVPRAPRAKPRTDRRRLTWWNSKT